MTDRTCELDGCTKPKKARGWCDTHYNSWRRKGDATLVKFRIPAKGLKCASPNCERECYAKTYCAVHYKRNRKGVYLETPIKPWGRGVETRLRDIGWTVTDTGCWEWNGAINSGGYGSINVSGRTVAVHRVSHTLFNGEIPEGLHVLHSCDNRKCLNPEHLRTGTNAENMKDRNERGRAARFIGSDHPRAKLSEQDVLDIRMDYATGQTTQRSLAEFYGVTPEHVSAIVNRLTWRHI